MTRHRFALTALVAFISNLTGDAPELDQNCLDDLLANGGR